MSDRDKEFGGKRTVILDQGDASASGKATRILSPEDPLASGSTVAAPASKLPPTQIFDNPGQSGTQIPNFDATGEAKSFEPPTGSNAPNPYETVPSTGGPPPVPDPSVSGRPASETRFLSPGEMQPGGTTGGQPTDTVVGSINPGQGQTTMDELAPVVGWLVVVGGPGKGAFRPIFMGNNSIGRDANQRIPLNLGDNSISAEEQCFIRYDYDDRSFSFIPNMSKTNIVTINKEKPMVPVGLTPLDEIGIGVTRLKFVPFCGPDFDWSDTEGDD